MATETPPTPVTEENQTTEQPKKPEQPAWYDFLIDIFKKILEFNYSSYGTKKKF